MAKEILDTTGIEWSQAIFTIASKVVSMQPGDILEITGTHPSFEEVILTWCERVKKKLISINPNGKGGMKCQIQF
jgi:TusA-related sulfurtransferase